MAVNDWADFVKDNRIGPLLKELSVALEDCEDPELIRKATKMMPKKNPLARHLAIWVQIMGNKDCGKRSAAPAEIWAFYDADLADDNCGATIIAHEQILHGAQRYVRADIYDKAMQELDGVIAMIGNT